MIDWRRGGRTGSVNTWARREVYEQLRENPISRRSRYGVFNRLLRCFFSIRTFGRFLGIYIAVNLAVLFAEAVLTWRAAGWLPRWTVLGPAPDLKSLLLNVSSYFITAQVGALGVITLALALVTLIAQRENSSTDIKVYYHESFAFEVVASCIALLAVLCVQLLWPAQFLLHRLGVGTDLQVFKFSLLGLHLLWLLLNFAGLAHFIATTFGFVQQSERARLRELYTANVVHPRDMAERLRQQLYGLATRELTGGDENGKRPSVSFGYDFGEPYTVELKSAFHRPTALSDVRMIWVRWVSRRWSGRCVDAARAQPSASHDLVQQAPLIWFTPHLDQPLRGPVSWCRRRGGVPLTWIEKVVLRLAFRFRGTDDVA
jgi:hypothetical protein